MFSAYLHEADAKQARRIRKTLGSSRLSSCAKRQFGYDMQQYSLGIMRSKHPCAIQQQLLNRHELRELQALMLRRTRLTITPTGSSSFGEAIIRISSLLGGRVGRLMSAWSQSKLSIKMAACKASNVFSSELL